MLFFSSYEYSKRALVNAGMPDFMAYLMSGLIGDFFGSAIYVPSEVFSSLLRFNGRWSRSGYSYKDHTTIRRSSRGITTDLHTMLSKPYLALILC
jgi:hypothetical protein